MRWAAACASLFVKSSEFEPFVTQNTLNGARLKKAPITERIFVAINMN